MRGKITLPLQIMKELVKKVETYGFRKPPYYKNEHFITSTGLTHDEIARGVILNLKESDFVKKEPNHKQGNNEVYIFKTIFAGEELYVKLEIMYDDLFLLIWSIHKEGMH
ncbi:MAG: type II toxin-antitoxin system MqsR family toxin [Firmicutes bacterium]|nr:type II toxin-antitoxin system MqsR family toxin [Bacillota bacterium]